MPTRQFNIESEGTYKLRVFAYYKGATNNHTYIIDNYETTS